MLTCAAAPGPTSSCGARAIGIVLGAIVGTVSLLVGGAWLAVRLMDGGTIKNVVKRAVQLLVILVTGMQVQVVVSERANSGLPRFITDLYSYLQIFTFTNLCIHPACTGKYGVFRVQLSLFLAASALLVLQVGLFVNWRRVLGCKCCGLRKSEMRSLFSSTVVDSLDIPDSALDAASTSRGTWASIFACCSRSLSITVSQRRLELLRQSEQKQRRAVLAAQPWHVRLGVAYAERKPLLRRLLFIVSMLMFPAIVSNILQAVHCVPKDVRVRDYRNMGQDGTTLRTLGIALRPTLQLNGTTGRMVSDSDSERIIRVRVLAHDPFFVCAEGEHRLVNAWALALLVVYVVFQPLATFFLSRAALARLVADTFAKEHHQALENDRQRQRAYLNDAGEGLTFAFRKLNVMLCCGGRRYDPGAGKTTSGTKATDPGGVTATFDTRNPLRSQGLTAASAPTPSINLLPASTQSTAASAIMTADDLGPSGHGRPVRGQRSRVLPAQRLPRDALLGAPCGAAAAAAAHGRQQGMAAAAWCRRPHQLAHPSSVHDVGCNWARRSSLRRAAAIHTRKRFPAQREIDAPSRGCSAGDRQFGQLLAPDAAVPVA